MKNVMEALVENLRKAFPKMPEETFARNKIPLSLAYLKKCQTYFNFAAMYPIETQDPVRAQCSWRSALVEFPAPSSSRAVSPESPNRRSRGRES